MIPTCIASTGAKPRWVQIRHVLTEVLTLPHEQIRKIIRVGNSLAVTIPKPWLRYYKLSDKDHVKVISNSTIIIEPPNKEK